MNKSFKILSLSIFTLLVLTSFVSALSISGPTLPISSGEHTIQLDIAEATANANITFNLTYDDELADIFDTVEIEDLTLIDNHTSGSADLVYEIPDDFDFDFGETYSITITAEEGSNPSINDSVTLTFEEIPFYEGENEGDLEISGLELNVAEGFGDDDDYWYPLDEVEVEFDVENNGEWDVENIEIKFCLWDKEDEKCLFDEDDVEIDNDDFDLDEGDEKTIQITFQVDPDELTKGNKDYTVYVSAAGNIDDNDAEEYDGDETGDSDSDEIEIITDDKFVIIDDIEIQPSSVSCGEKVELTAKVWNVGDEDLDDDEVYVQIYNKELGIDEVVEFESGIDAMDYEKISLSFEIPNDVEERTYAIKLVAYDDNDMDEGDIFQTDEEEDEASYFGTVEIKGNCIVEDQIVIVANLESEVKSGEDLIIKATITNTGDNLVTYTLNVVDYNEWATLVDIEPSTIILSAGSSEDVLITLNVNKDVEGDKLFNIEVLSEDEPVVTQPVSITIEEQPGFNFPGITGNLISENNWYLWGIGALNILLVIIIIVVALKVARK